MYDPYQVLGVSPGVPDEEVKRAFRRLAKELHPDLRPGDAAAGARFREVVSAYHALMGGEAPVAWHAQGRPGMRTHWATMTGVFLLTVSSAALALMLRGASEMPRPAGPAPSSLPAVTAASVAGAVAQATSAADGAATGQGSAHESQVAEAAATQQASSGGPPAGHPPLAAALASIRA